MNEGQKVYFFDFKINAQNIVAIDHIDGIDKYWLTEMFGYFTKDNLFGNKNDCIDQLISILEMMKEEN